VTFERRLGSVADRVERIAALAAEIAPMVGADAEAAKRRRASPRPICIPRWSTNSPSFRA
jgi:hypothetical protein